MRRPNVALAAVAAVSILYPLAASFAVRTVGPTWVVAALCVLLLARFALNWKGTSPGLATWGLLAVAACVAIVALFDRTLSVRLYPVLMNVAMLCAFAQTLWRGPSMIERFARIMEPNLPESGVRYTRAVTAVWCLFFVVNGAIAAWTALYADWATWTWYNGVVAYLAMGILFAAEFLARPFARRAFETA